MIEQYNCFECVHFDKENLQCKAHSDMFFNPILKCYWQTPIIPQIPEDVYIAIRKYILHQIDSVAVGTKVLYNSLDTISSNCGQVNIYFTVIGQIECLQLLIYPEEPIEYFNEKLKRELETIQSILISLVKGGGVKVFEFRR